MYWFYEMGHVATDAGARLPGCRAHDLQGSCQSVLPYLRRQGRSGGFDCSSDHAALQPAGLGHRSALAAASVFRCTSCGTGAAFLPAVAFRARARPCTEPAAAETPDRRADVEPLCHAVARTVEASFPITHLHHRMGRCPHGAARRGGFDLDADIDYVISMLHALGRRDPCRRGVPASSPVLAAVAIMEAADDPYVALSMTLMGGPIDSARTRPS